MKKEAEHQHIKRTQKDYTMAFKLGVVQEVERGEIGICAVARKYGIQCHKTVTTWLQKYGSFDWENRPLSKPPKSKDQVILEQEARIRLLEKQNARLEHELKQTDKKALFFDMMIDMAEEEFKIPIRKNCSPEPSENLHNEKKRR